MEAFIKKWKSDGEPEQKRKKLETCPHALKCYRKNPHHFKEFSHPHLNEMIDNGDKLPDNLPLQESIYLDQIKILKPLLQPVKDQQKASASTSSQKNRVENTKMDVTAEKGTSLEKWQRNSPYFLFFSTIPNSPSTLNQSNSITFSDLLCPSLGKLHSSLQINFMIDIMWLLKQYKKHNMEKKPLTILYGDDWPDMEEFIAKYCPNVTSQLIKMKDPFGCHHSKIGIYRYEDNSLRIVVSTANLYYEDWNNYNQALWISPPLPQLAPNSPPTAGDSPTQFKKSLLSYLQSYHHPHLKQWIEHVQAADFGAIRVFFVASQPGRHYPNSNGSHAHYVAQTLSKHCALPKKGAPGEEGPLEWGIVAQSSSLGNMGKGAGDWLRSTLLRSLSAHKNASLTLNSNANLNLIYPSVKNVIGGYFGVESGGCLPYSKAANDKQKWLQGYLHQWKADRLGRSRAMPHIKTYCRISPCLTKLAWFLVTSANISKAAWGTSLGKDSSVYIRSCEVGVLFVPEFFNEEYFQIGKTMQSDNNLNMFPFIYDLPLTEYEKDDSPWCN